MRLQLGAIARSGELHIRAASFRPPPDPAGIRLALVESGLPVPDDLEPLDPADPDPADPADPDDPADPTALADLADLDRDLGGLDGNGAGPDAGEAGSGTAALLESLVSGAVDGDPQARDALLGVIHPMVLRYCRARLGRQECVIGSADDVAQDVCLAVVRALPNYTIKGLSFRAFVYGIAAHKVTDAFRAIGRNRAEPVAEVPDTAVHVDGPEHRALAIELGERLGGLLHILTPRQREVIVLRIAVGLNAEETAHAVRSTPGAVRVTQHRALIRLREFLLAQEAAVAGGTGSRPARADRDVRVV
jgi:RNA polymerase sigma-70 factor (ECF subfamily)